MSLVAGESISKCYDADFVFTSATFNVAEGERVGLVGPNGQGKTTLLRIIAGALEPTEGQLTRARTLRMGYLPQDPPERIEAGSLRDVLLGAFEEVFAVEQQMHEWAGQMADRPDDAACRKRYADCQTRFEAAGGYEIDQRVDRVLSGLGFSAEQGAMPAAHLSGGQLSRAMLGRLLLEEPDLLLLDEPTNHLDLSAVEWLERYLQEVRAAMVIVSHDRYFLDRVTSRTWEVAAGGLSCYRGGYSDYVRQRRQRLLEQTRLYEQQQAYIAKTEEFIRRNLAGQRTKEAQGRRTRLERFKATEAIARPQEIETISLHLAPDRLSSENVLRTHDLSAGYEEGRPMVTLPEVEVTRRRRIAIVGPNGCGKTTLLRTLRGELPALSGQVRWGANVDVGYLSQAHEELAGGGTVFQAVHRVDPGRSPEQVRTLLGSMGFAGDDAFKKVEELSGGQRSRVILAQLATQGANVLLLDEPTNHLDLPSREILQETLNQFEGTVIMVSHDRYLIDSVATDIWAIADGVLHRIYGNWEDYLTWRTAHEAGQASTSTSTQKARAADKQAGRDAHHQRKERNRLIRRHEKLEAQIHQGEQKLAELSEAISAAGQDGDLDQVESLGRQYQQAQQQLDELLAEWERIGEQIEMSDA